MRLNAFTAPTIQNTVMKASSQTGSPGHSSENPSPAHLHARNAQTTCPASLTFGLSENLSSSHPSAVTPVAIATSFQYVAVVTPSPCSGGRPETSVNTEYEAITPRKSAMPPPRGMGTLLIRLGSGVSTIPSLRFMLRTRGVRTSVRTSAAPNATA